MWILLFCLATDFTPGDIETRDNCRFLGVFEKREEAVAHADDYCMGDFNCMGNVSVHCIHDGKMD